MRWLSAFFILVSVVVSPLFVSAQRSKTVKVRVIDLGGERAYLNAGLGKGLTEGTAVRFGKRKYRVVAANKTTSAVALKGRTLKIGERGRASVVKRRVRSTRRSKPMPLANFKGQWPRAVLPATKQNPEYLPLGRFANDSRIDLVLSAGVDGVIALGGGKSFARSNLRVRLHAEPFDAPLSFDVDAAIQYWFAGNLNARAGSASRPIARIRQLQVAYGDSMSFQAAGGRLPYVASGVGLLDGVRLRTPVFGGFSIGAFGGFTPDPIDGRPSSDAARFGVQLRYDDDLADTRPSLSLSVHGSTYNGDLDERRINAEFAFFPSDARLMGHLELSLHDGNNPWLAKRVEVSAAGFDASLRKGVLEVAGRFDLRLPERSLWLNSFLPTGWLCNTATDANAPTSDEVVCIDGNQARYFGGADVTIRLDRVSIHAGANVAHTQDRDELEQVGGYAQVRLLRIRKVGWADLSLSGFAGSFVNTYAARIGVGASLGRRSEVSFYYRGSINDYDTDIDRWLESGFGGTLFWSVRDDLSLGLRGDAVLGRDLDVLLLQTNLTWHPSW